MRYRPWKRDTAARRDIWSASQTVPFQFSQEVQRFDRRQPIDVQAAKPLDDPMGLGLLEQAELLLRRGGRAVERRASAALKLILLERTENLRRAADHGRRNAGQPGHLNAVAAIGAARHDFVKKHDV